MNINLHLIATVSILSIGLSVPSKAISSEHKYAFNRIGSPHLDGKKLLPGYGELVYDLKESYVFDGTSVIDFKTCKSSAIMMCFNDSAHGWLLYLPRNKTLWTTWKFETETYIFEEWKQYPFSPPKTTLAAIHVFSNKTLDDRKQMGGLSYPIATYFIDKETRLVGMMQYSLQNPKHRGLNDNQIESFYWAKEFGLPLMDF